jgi:hypothetical protein
MKTVRNPSEEHFPLPDQNQATSQDIFGTNTAVAHRVPEPTNVASWLDQSAVRTAAKTNAATEVGMGYTMFVQGGQDRDNLGIYHEPQVGAPVAKMQLQQQQQQTVYDVLSNLMPEDVRIPRELPPTTTYSFQETTFARRLHRACLEAGYYILLDTKRRPDSFEKVFKLSLMGRDPSKLAASLKSILSRGVNESLDFWEAPLIHVGGAGTHYPRRDHLGNLQARKSSYNLGLVGPQTLALLENAAKNNLSTDMTVEIAGYEGEWFDPYDVEGYLKERGIHIDPTSSFVEAEITDYPESTGTVESSGPPTPPVELTTTSTSSPHPKTRFGTDFGCNSSARAFHERSGRSIERDYRLRCY